MAGVTVPPRAFEVIVPGYGFGVEAQVTIFAVAFALQDLPIQVVIEEHRRAVWRRPQPFARRFASPHRGRGERLQLLSRPKRL